jgi:hypothetical protein
MPTGEISCGIPVEKTTSMSPVANFLRRRLEIRIPLFSCKKRLSGNSAYRARGAAARKGRAQIERSAVLGRLNARQDARQCDEQRHQRQTPDKDAEIAEVYPFSHPQERANG